MVDPRIAPGTNRRWNRWRPPRSLEVEAQIQRCKPDRAAADCGTIFAARFAARTPVVGAAQQRETAINRKRIAQGEGWRTLLHRSVLGLVVILDTGRSEFIAGPDWQFSTDREFAQFVGRHLIRNILQVEALVASRPFSAPGDLSENAKRRGDRPAAHRDFIRMLNYRTERATDDVPALFEEACRMRVPIQTAATDPEFFCDSCRASPANEIVFDL
jgi:hypothetical protein